MTAFIGYVRAAPTNPFGCAQHHRRLCDECGCDYTLSPEYLEDPELDRFMTRGPFAAPPDLPLRPALTFNPPRSTSMPRHLFETREHYCGWRFFRKNNPRQILLFTDGACLSNGTPNAQGGCGVLIHDHVATHPNAGRVVHRLEKRGPQGGPPQVETSNRAELRAVLLALNLRHWPGEGFTSMVIATDSEYVVQGLTTWCRTWLMNGWRTSNGHSVTNQDLWKALLRKITDYKHCDMDVMMWRIPRQWNKDADGLAREAAAHQPGAPYFGEHALMDYHW